MRRLGRNRRLPDRAERAAAVRGALGRYARAFVHVTATLLLLGGGAWGFLATLRWTLTSPTFAIRAVDVSGVERLDPATLRAASGLLPGQNLFRADLAEAERAIAQNPWVQRVQATRLLSRHVAVQVVERKPVAQLALGSLYLVDAEGELFKRVAPDDGIDLPLLTGIDRATFDGDRPEARSEISSALALLGELERRHLPEVSEIQVDRQLGLTAYLGPEAIAVKLGWGDLDGKLDRYQRTRSELQRRNLKVAAVDLTDAQHPGRIGLSPALAEAAH